MGGWLELLDGGEGARFQLRLPTVHEDEMPTATER
jgi:hypothetical protein